MQFRKDAIWCAKKGLSGSGMSFESSARPGRCLREYYGDLYVANKTARNRFDVEKDFDASWKIVTPLAR